MHLLTPDSMLVIWESMLLLFVVGLGATIWALIHILKSEFKQPNDKLIWVIVVTAFNLVGVLIYFFVGRSQRVV